MESVDQQIRVCRPDDLAMTPRTGVIAVVGEALVDLVLEPDGNAATHLGGGSFNAARTLGRLGLQPLFVGRLSRDSYGRALRAGLEESGVRLDGIIDTSDPTTFARVEVDADGVASYRFYIDGTSAPGLLPSDARAVMPAAPAAIHVGGLGLVLEPHASTIATLVAGAAPSTLVFVDPNCRPAAIADPLAYRRRLAAILARADVVKVSRDDLAWLEPDLPPLHAARRWLDRGPALILLTDGKRGATVLASAGHLHIDGVRAEVIDTIGAGDAFGAAWLGAWVTDDLGPADLTDLYAVVRAARFASLIAARTCERPGAEPPRAVKVGPEWCVAGVTPGTTSLAE